MNNLREKVKNVLLPSLQKELGISNSMAAPRLEKVVLNIGFGRLVTANPQMKEKTLGETSMLMRLITGQTPAPRKAKKSIAGFKLREGEVIGYQVTLRGQRMYDFVDRFVRIALPRTRDFRGISLGAVDARGNLTIGVKEHIVFPETAGEETKQLYGLEVTFVPRALSRDHSVALYRALGIPFARS